MMEAHKIEVTRTAHFYTLGIAGPSTQYCIIACHGYGQLAKNFIRKFDGIAGEDTLVIAPEALSKFYWQGFSGDPVASWMTREHRLDEILDYCRYLSQLYLEYKKILPENVKIILFGFSQGCATQMRWVFQDQPTFDTLVLWAGMMPDDLDYLANVHLWMNRDVHFIYGTQDEFITPERMDHYQTFFQNNQIPVVQRRFTGTHTVDRATLAEWFAEYKKR
jgi:predicted esterase